MQFSSQKKVTLLYSLRVDPTLGLQIWTGKYEIKTERECELLHALWNYICNTHNTEVLICVLSQNRGAIPLFTTHYEKVTSTMRSKRKFQIKTVEYN